MRLHEKIDQAILERLDRILAKIDVAPIPAGQVDAKAKDTHHKGA